MQRLDLDLPDFYQKIQKICFSFFWCGYNYLKWFCNRQTFESISINKSQKIVVNL